MNDDSSELIGIGTGLLSSLRLNFGLKLLEPRQLYLIWNRVDYQNTTQVRYSLPMIKEVQSAWKLLIEKLKVC